MPRGVRQAGLPPINKHSSPITCMVVGCGRAAMYRSPQSTRGYCGLHKDLVSAAPVPGSTADYYQRFDGIGSAKPSLDYYDKLGAHGED